MIIIKISSKLKNDNPLPCSIHIEDFFFMFFEMKDEVYPDHYYLYQD